MQQHSRLIVPLMCAPSRSLQGPIDGLEPPTHRLQGDCTSIVLYRHVRFIWNFHIVSLFSQNVTATFPAIRERPGLMETTGLEPACRNFFVWLATLAHISTTAFQTVSHNVFRAVVALLDFFVKGIFSLKRGNTMLNMKSTKHIDSG